jgi:hypothetical protein
MSKRKPTTSSRAKKKAEVSLVRSSAAEYLTFVAAGGDSESSVEMRYEDENIWLTQRMMAELYGVSIPAINQHLKRIFSDNELEESAVIKQYLITAADGKAYQTKHYSLQAIIAVGFKIETSGRCSSANGLTRSSRTTPSKGWTMDSDERLKQGGLLTDKFFERQLEKIREIGSQSGSSTKRSQTSTPQRWTTTHQQLRRSASLPQCKTRCTTPCMVRQRPK